MNVPIVIFTALSNERQAIEYHLTETKEVFHETTDTLYKVGSLFINGSQIWIAIVETEANNTKAGIEVERAIGYFNPKYVFFIGVAGGLKEDVKLGDIVVASKIYAYEVGKADTEYRPRFEFGEPSYSLKQFAKSVKDTKKWLGNINPNYSLDIEVDVYVKPIAAGEKVVSSKRSQVYKFLKKNCSDALAVAMEEYGFTESIKAHKEVEGIVIRGISDLINGKSKADALGFQEIAAANASAFGLELIGKLVEQGRVDISNPEQWIDKSVDKKKLGNLLSELYSKGITEKNIWSRADGDLSDFNIALSGKEQWYNALEFLKKGGGTSITFQKLLEVALEDFPMNKELQSITKKKIGDDVSDGMQQIINNASIGKQVNINTNLGDIIL